MIVVVGFPAWRPSEPAGPAGRACAIAIAAAASGSPVEIVGRIGDDPSGDSLLFGLARAGVGHAAVLRDPARPTPSWLPVADADAADPLAEAPEPAAPVAAPAAAPRLERDDVVLALSYLTSFRVLVVADDVPPEVVPACVDGAAFAGAHLVVLVPDGSQTPTGLPETATVLAAPPLLGDDGFAGVVAAYAAALDRGVDPAQAFAAAVGRVAAAS